MDAWRDDAVDVPLRGPNGRTGRDHTGRLRRLRLGRCWEGLTTEEGRGRQYGQRVSAREGA